TVDDFRLDFSARPFRKSVWNQQAARVFTEVYLSSDGSNEDAPTVKEEFLGRLKRIHDQYCIFLQTSEENAQDSDDEMESMPRKSRRNSAAAKRQSYQLFQSRLTAIQSHTSMRRFVPTLHMLSSGGMSEDESDHDLASEDEGDQAEGENGRRRVPRSAPQRRQFKITKSQWRSPEVTKWLRIMDLLHIGTRFNDDGTPMPGNQARERYPSNKTQTGRPITGLPRNFYNAEWLTTLSPGQLVDLDVQPEVDISFTVDERRYVLSTPL
ncbi:hypothetical protein EDB85DRAFT_1871863, partial [Lactarius pseudohatsudake]